uniref:TLC domain-containing protein n=1 Tax=Chromera velia CCMP2878 TaxID=1169474 RepID=A0A0G4HW40_9ALVE|eukprot:Cvel_8977.t1-p1 / transcript=Cvel_8977.t1 / gene=Cvel_8977 / organism=Chromera_velia_CCMP2878 / gene_product=hypothetical protein / transcript_product=hypothetical protein / location=Cvel_scaffold506:58336-60334(-) / protein_length=550 / sequence_SO=supercontig / SO=protein_coding / is_pseudo=false
MFLTRVDVAVYGLCCAFLTTWILSARVLVRKYASFKSESRACAWLVAVPTSLVMTSAGLMAILDLVKGVQQGVLVRELLFAEPTYARWLCCYFLAHCHVDLVLAYALWPKEIDMLTGPIHHGIYTVFLLFCILRLDLSYGFALFGVDEFPNVLLAVGNIHTPWRQDWTFGITWLVLRILWHTVAMFLVVSNLGFSSYFFVCFVSIGSFVMHIWWWWGWLSSKIPGMKKKKSPAQTAPPSSKTEKKEISPQTQNSASVSVAVSPENSATAALVDGVRAQKAQAETAGASAPPSEKGEGARLLPSLPAATEVSNTRNESSTAIPGKDSQQGGALRNGSSSNGSVKNPKRSQARQRLTGGNKNIQTQQQQKKSANAGGKNNTPSSPATENSNKRLGRFPSFPLRFSLAGFGAVALAGEHAATGSSRSGPPSRDSDGSAAAAAAAAGWRAYSPLHQGGVPNLRVQLPNMNFRILQRFRENYQWVMASAGEDPQDPQNPTAAFSLTTGLQMIRALLENAVESMAGEGGQNGQGGEEEEDEGAVAEELPQAVAARA